APDQTAPRVCFVAAVGRRPEEQAELVFAVGEVPEFYRAPEPDDAVVALPALLAPAGPHGHARPGRVVEFGPRPTRIVAGLRRPQLARIATVRLCDGRRRQQEQREEKSGHRAGAAPGAP